MSNDGNRANSYVPNSCITDELGGHLATIFDFDVHGGAIGTIELPGEIPANAVIVGAHVDVLTDPTSGGAATVALGLDTNVDLLAATAIGSVTGVVTAKTQSDTLKIGSNQKIKVTIATAALTAGRMAIDVCWIGPFDNVVPR